MLKINYLFLVLYIVVIVIPIVLLQIYFNWQERKELLAKLKSSKKKRDPKK
jgi:NADH:ubiquinone oxidoreductase subunit H